MEYPGPSGEAEAVFLKGPFTAEAQRAERRRRESRSSLRDLCASAVKGAFKTHSLELRQELFPFRHIDPLFHAVAPDLRHIHRVSEYRQRVKSPRRFGAQVVADFPHAFGQVVNE